MKFLTKKKGKVWLAIFSTLLLLLAYLLFPLSSTKYKITFSQEKIAFKQEFLGQVSSQNQNLPNIIVILADDLGKTDISLYGSPYLKTPWMDTLGLMGATFMEGYTTAPICSPARAALMTGRYQQRFGYEYQPQNRYLRNRLEYYAYKYIMDTDFWLVNDAMACPYQEDLEKQGLPPSEITLAELLKKNGYQTGILGKWHLGNYAPFYPIHRGFDEQYGFYEAFTLFADTSDQNIVNHHHSDFSDPYIWGRGREGSCAIRRNHQIINEDEYLTFAIAREANQFIENNQSNSFFLYIPFNAPHTPFQAPKSYFDQFPEVEDHNKRTYYAMIKALDDAVGQILRKLRSLGLEENTLICFASDNGGATYTYATDNAPLKGGKMSNFEGGINIPMMMYWKGRISSRQVVDAPVTLMDFFGTAVELARVDLPEDRIFDAKNLLPYLEGKKKGHPHTALYWKTGFNKAIRKDRWKLILNEYQKDTLLYDLQNDKIEKTNLARKKPQVIQSLLKDYQSWEDKLDSPHWPRVVDFEIEIDGKLYRYAQ